MAQNKSQKEKVLQFIEGLQKENPRLYQALRLIIEDLHKVFIDVFPPE